MEITENLINTSVNQISELLKQHLNEINQGFEANDEIIEIPIKARFSFVDGKLKSLPTSILSSSDARMTQFPGTIPIRKNCLTIDFFLATVIVL